MPPEAQPERASVERTGLDGRLIVLKNALNHWLEGVADVSELGRRGTRREDAEKKHEAAEGRIERRAETVVIIWTRI